MRILKHTLLALTMVVWAGAATAASIDAVVIGPPGYVESSALPSDIITVEITLSSEIITTGWFFHVNWTPNLSVVSTAITYPSYWSPAPSGSWSYLAGHGTIDAGGFYLNAYDTGTMGGLGAVFNDWLLGTLVFHVVEEGPGAVGTIEPYLTIDDQIGGDTYQAIEDQFAKNAATIHTPEPTAGALALAAIVTLGALKYWRRKQH